MLRLPLSFIRDRMQQQQPKRRKDKLSGFLTSAFKRLALPLLLLINELAARQTEQGVSYMAVGFLGLHKRAESYIYIYGRRRVSRVAER